ncbi:MAG: Maf family protein [candidate division Zixibacteria bacterium]|nr:Maf family protein [candidate division Zixibacteria bacterium]
MTVAIEPRRFIITVDEQIKSELKALLGDTPVTLASGSPRRREILVLAGLTCRVIVPDVDEDIPVGVSPEQFAIDIATHKLAHVPGTSGITVAADTIVVLDNRILGKPVDKTAAKEMLRILSGRRHYVITALALRDNVNGLAICDCEKSYVTFHPQSNEAIAAYVDSGEPMDKAGAYGIQGMGELLVEKLEGNLHNVIGFPIELFVRMIRELQQ